MDRKDRKGMYTNTFLHFLLAYNQVKQGLRTINKRWLIMLNAKLATVSRLETVARLEILGG